MRWETCRNSLPPCRRHHRPSISSKTTKGILQKDLQSIPPNYGSALSLFLFVIFLITTPFLAIDSYKSINSTTKIKEQNDNYSFLKEEGWTEYQRFIDSELSKLYIDKEFPIYQSSMKREGDTVLINYKLINKYSREMKFTISYENPYKKFDLKPLENRTAYTEDLEPHEIKDLTIKVYYPKKYMDNIKIRFSIMTKGNIFVFYKTINMNI